MRSRRVSARPSLSILLAERTGAVASRQGYEVQSQVRRSLWHRLLGRSASEPGLYVAYGLAVSADREVRSDSSMGKMRPPEAAPAHPCL